MSQVLIFRNSDSGPEYRSGSSNRKSNEIPPVYGTHITDARSDATSARIQASSQADQGADREFN